VKQICWAQAVRGLKSSQQFNSLLPGDCFPSIEDADDEFALALDSDK
jgi:hypothetical protein